MNRDDRIGAWLLTIPSVSLLVTAWRTGGPINLAGFPTVCAALAVVLGVALLWLMSRRVNRAHAHGGDRASLARHEAGHAEAARRLGRLHSATITGDSGWVDATLRDDGPLAAVTFLLAGQVAAGQVCGSRSDDAAIRRELRTLPRRERDGVLTQARRDAERIVSTGRGRIDRDAARLHDRGRL